MNEVLLTYLHLHFASIDNVDVMYLDTIQEAKRESMFDQHSIMAPVASKFTVQKL